MRSLSSARSVVASVHSPRRAPPRVGPRPGPLHAAAARRLRRVRWLTRVTDTALPIPGTGLRFGLDSVIGLVPGLGDLTMTLVSLWIVREAQQLGLPPHLLKRMLGNIAIDFLGGAIPLIGDGFDLYWKANQRNAKLLETYLRAPPSGTAGRSPS